MKTIIDQMLNRYSEFTKSERKIVDYILEHKSDVQYLSITDLSTVCKVSISTLSVFCRKLGAEGFNVFKLELAKATMPQMPVSMRILLATFAPAIHWSRSWRKHL